MLSRQNDQNTVLPLRKLTSIGGGQKKKEVESAAQKLSVQDRHAQMKREMVANGDTTLFNLNWEGHDTFPVMTLAEAAKVRSREPLKLLDSPHIVRDPVVWETRQVTNDGPVDVDLHQNSECKRDGRTPSGTSPLS